MISLDLYSRAVIKSLLNGIALDFYNRVVVNVLDSYFFFNVE